jgi:translation initiation factor IF-3
LLTKINHVRRLVPKNDVRVTIIFRGREMTHPDIGRRLLNRVIEETKDIAEIKSKTDKGNVIFAVLTKK